MAETNLSNPFNFNRRQLLASAAAAATAGIVPGVDRAGARQAGRGHDRSSTSG